MTPAPVVRLADLPRDWPAIERMCWDYRDYLCALPGEVGAVARSEFNEQNWRDMLNTLSGLHSRPRGAVLLAELDGHPVGCGMVHPLSSQDAEFKRVYVAQSARGTGLGRALTQELIDRARKDGYSRVLLDTTIESRAAARLYEKMGFQARGPYADLPETLEKVLLFYELYL